MEMYEGVQLEIAKYIGEPINNNLPVPVEISKIADVHVVEPGEKAWYYASQDTDDDEIYQVNTSTGALTVVKRSPLDVTELTFQGLNSKKEYVLLDSVIQSPDQQVLGRKKARLAHALDKLELRLILAAITASDADYADNRQVAVQVPVEANTLWEFPTSGLVAADIGVDVDLTDSVSVNRAATAIGAVKVLKVITAVKGQGNIKFRGSF